MRPRAYWRTSSGSRTALYQGRSTTLLSSVVDPPDWRLPSTAPLKAWTRWCSVPGKVYDIVVVGGGPAGLATAVYGASEGLDTLVLCTREGLRHCCRRWWTSRTGDCRLRRL